MIAAISKFVGWIGQLSLALTPRLGLGIDQSDVETAASPAALAWFPLAQPVAKGELLFSGVEHDPGPEAVAKPARQVAQPRKSPQFSSATTVTYGPWPTSDLR